MSARVGELERERQMLVARSSLGRLRLRRDLHRLRRPLHLPPLVGAVAKMPVFRAAALGLALSVFGARRVARGVRLAASILYFVRLAR
jgi:hypothetical protein